MSGTTLTFTYPASGATGTYDWSVSSTWNTGTVPTDGDSVIVGHQGYASTVTIIALDDIQLLTLASLDTTTGTRTVAPGTMDIAAGDTLIVTGAVSGTGSIQLLGDNTTLEIGVTQTIGPIISFDASAAGPEELILTGSLSQGQSISGGRISNFVQGDTIDFQGFSSIDAPVVNASTVTITGNLSGGGTATYEFSQPISAGTTFRSVGNMLEATCFAAGSRILTPEGERPVEALAEGDLVTIVGDGGSQAEPIVWVGRLRIELFRHARPETVAPVRIRRGAFAEAVPHRDLLLSPEHCVFADGRLIPARCLVNRMTIVQELDRPVVEYYHIETARHAIVLAEGLPTETYLDTGNRAIFENAGVALMLHPEFQVNAGLRQWQTDACAPLASDPATIEPIWRRLADRAGVLGYVPPEPATTTDTALRLLAGGRELRPVTLEPGLAVFALPAGASEVALLSRRGSPADLAPWRNDHRRLGVAVRRIVIRSGNDERTIAADHPALAGGWHPVEGDGSGLWRWTDGHGRIPLGGMSGAATVEVHLCGEMTYCLPQEIAERSAA